MAERLANPPALGEPDESGRARLEAWERLYEEGPHYFGRRLAAAGVNRARVLRALSEGTGGAQSRPQWLRDLEELIRRPVVARAEARVSLIESDASDPSMPFGEALRPLLRRGSAGLQNDPIWRSQSPAARQAFERLLAVRMLEVLGLILGFEFALFRADRSAPWASPASAASTQLYGRFVDFLRGGDWAALFGRYPVAARLTALAYRQWRQSTLEVLHRLERDRATLSASLGVAGAELSGVWALSDDRHLDGRHVLALAFEDGTAVVYKPRPAGIEDAFYSLLLWFRANCPELDFVVPARVIGNGYGWFELMRPQPGADLSGSAACLTRCGHLLAVLYVVRATDCHADNISNIGEHPVLLDAETLFCAPSALLPDTLDDSVHATVRGTGFLPGSGSERLGDVSPLAPPGRRRGTRLSWRDVNTDNMAIVVASGGDGGYGSRSSQSGAGSGLEPRSMTANLVEGFEDAYRAIAAVRSALLAPAGPWSRFRGRRGRHVPRPTFVYGQVLQRALRPDNTSDGVSFDLALEPIATPWYAKSAAVWPIAEAELTALRRLDVPRFEFQVDETALRMEDGRRIDGFFSSSGFDLATRRLRALGESDLARQREEIARALD